jgi:hypothetical protein
MRRVSLLSLGSAAICKTSIAVAGDCSQDEEPQLAIDARAVIITASRATNVTRPLRTDSARTDYSDAFALQPMLGGAYNNRACDCYSARSAARALLLPGKLLRSGSSMPMCSTRKRMFSRFQGVAQTPFWSNAAVCALIPSLKGAKKVIGGWVQRLIIQMRPAKLIWKKYSRPLAWRGMRPEKSA